METLDEHLAAVAKSPRGPKIAALFDFDGTIIAGYSAMALLKEKFKRRQMSAEEIVETLAVMGQYRAGGIGFSGLMASGAKFMRGVSEESFAQFGEELYEKHIARKVYPEARALIQAHLDRGHRVAIVSSATRYQIEPAARDLGISDVLCSAYEVERGEFTGNIVRPLCFGDGKVSAAEIYAAKHGIDLARSYFYSDSADDIALLEQVGQPRPLNPDTKLRAAARRHGWPVLSFSSRGSPTALDYARTISATTSMIGAFTAGIGLYGVTRSKREATNFATALYGDIGAAIAGIELDVHGEENLWKSRPCVFLLNHQSKADVIIMAKLVRRDMGGVAKKEARNVPVLGKLLELAGIIFIDRQNTGSAIKAMEPLVAAIRNEGKSIVIAPEGTRTLTPKLNPFKKGAFHLAMQAGVPIVPVVIHNAHDVAPKNEFIMRPAKVRVDVLPPIESSAWSVETLDVHIAEVRNLYLEALGQPAQPLPGTAAKARASATSVRKAKPRAAKPVRKAKTTPVLAGSADE